MAFLNNDILIHNILTLMKNNDITQQQLADILGMSQPNISKALNLKDKKCFTLDQVVGIAKHFGVSVDFLVGTKKTNTHDISPRSVAEFFSHLIENHDAKYRKIDIEEIAFEPTSFDYADQYGEYFSDVKKTVSYLAIYFPDYWAIPDENEVGPQDFEDYLFEARQGGNDTRMQPVNDFLRKFVQIFEVYDKNGIDEDAYRTVVDNYLGRLKGN